MRGSWAGAMGHTQWMPDTWLTLGMDYDGDGRVSPFGPPDDALGSSARFLVRRGKYRRGETLPSTARAAGVQKAYMTERGFAVLAAVEKVAAGLGVTPTQVAISWLAHRPGITAPIASATSKTQLRELVAGVELQLDAEARKAELAEFLLRCVRECRPLLDPSIPLGIPAPMSKPQRGPTPNSYYKKKHEAGNYGTYFLHHVWSYR